MIFFNFFGVAGLDVRSLGNSLLGLSAGSSQFESPSKNDESGDARGENGSSFSSELSIPTCKEVAFEKSSGISSLIHDEPPTLVDVYETRVRKSLSESSFSPTHPELGEEAAHSFSGAVSAPGRSLKDPYELDGVMRITSVEERPDADDDRENESLARLWRPLVDPSPLLSNENVDIAEDKDRRLGS